MSVSERIKEVLQSFPKTSELARLQKFLAEMKAAGIAKTREYDLPQPDTIGRGAAEVAQIERRANRGEPIAP